MECGALSVAARALGVFALVALALAGPAAAADMRSIVRAESIARSYFPQACQPSLEFRDLGPTEMAEAYTGGQPQCTIIYNTTVWSEPWFLLCAATVHEFGHLVGYSHAASPRSIMHSPLSILPRRCKVRGYSWGYIFNPVGA